MKFKIASAQYALTQFKHNQDWNSKIESWIKEAVVNKADLLVFPEYGSLELISLFSESVRKDLKSQILKMDELKDSFVLAFQELAKKYQIHILAPSLPVLNESKKPVNRAYFFGPDGRSGFQEKQFMTRFEDEEWGIQSGEPVLTIFDTRFGKIGVLICFDSEFALDATTLSKNGVRLILIPSCTETAWGLNRVHIGARSRALENQIYCVVSSTVKESSWCLAVDQNTGQGLIVGPPDIGFPQDGVLARGSWNQEQWLYFELDMEFVDNVRKNGAVLNYKNSKQLKFDDKKIQKVKIS